MPRYRDLTGQTFGRLTVLGLDHIKEGRAIWKCQCSCDKQAIVLTKTNRLTAGEVKSCGCINSRLTYGQQSVDKRRRIKLIRILAADGYKSDQIAAKIGLTPSHVRLLSRGNNIELADAVIGITRALDVNRVMNETVLGAQSLTAGLDLLVGRTDALDASKLESWLVSLTDSINILETVQTQLMRGVARANQTKNQQQAGDRTVEP